MRVEEKVLVSRMSAPAIGVGVMDVLDRLRLGEGQKVVVALEMALAGLEAVAAEMLLLERQALDLRPHGAVEDENSLARGLGEGCGRVLGLMSVGDALENVAHGPDLFQECRHNRIKISLYKINPGS